MSETREVFIEDVWAAIRGLELWSADDDTLHDMLRRYEDRPLFADRAITEAVRQVMAVRRLRPR